MKTYKFNINGNSYEVEIKNVEDKTIELELNGTPYSVELDKEVKQVKTPKLVTPVAVPSTDSTPESVKTTSGVTLGTIKSPLPGTILDVFVKVGDTVALGQKLFMLEAMKMENNIECDKAGVVSEIKVNKGDSVMEGDVLMVIGG